MKVSANLAIGALVLGFRLHFSSVSPDANLCFFGEGLYDRIPTDVESKLMPFQREGVRYYCDPTFIEYIFYLWAEQ
jgi:hypothetical protein